MNNLVNYEIYIFISLKYRGILHTEIERELFFLNRFPRLHTHMFDSSIKVVQHVTWYVPP